jgi:glucose/arabinose dehydrogenase
MKKVLKILLLPFLVAIIFPAFIHAANNERKINADAIKVPDGYHIEAFAKNLSVPTTAIFDQNDLIVAESGWKDTAKPRILRIKDNGEVQTLAQDGLLSPVTGLLKVDGKLYISHKGKVSVLENGKLRDVVTGLPSNGDHQNNNIVLGPDKKIYIGQGTVTNSGVVGEDNSSFGWLPQYPREHDVPCRDVTLTGQNFQTSDVLNKDNKNKVNTGAYKSFGTESKDGEVIKGNTKCNGSILRFNPDGSSLEMYAWGFRNPFGLKFDKSGQLFATFHGADVRGSRSIYEDSDYFVKVKKDGWYGWPEYFDGKPVTDPRFKDPTRSQPTFLWKDHPKLDSAYLTFPSHSASNGFAFSPGGNFGYQGDAFVAYYGSYSVATAGTDVRLPGFKIVKVDMKSKEISDFAINNLPGPSYINLQGGFDRPSDVVFGPDSSMYVIDWGASTIGPQGLKYVAGSGVIWRVYKDGMNALRHNGPVGIAQASIPADQQKAELRNIPETYKGIAPQLLLIGGVIIAAVLIAALVIVKSK